MSLYKDNFSLEICAGSYGGALAALEAVRTAWNCVRRSVKVDLLLRKD